MADSFNIDIVIPVTERHEDIERIYSAYRAPLASCCDSLTFIFVVDGGFTDAAAQVQALERAHDDVRAIVLSRAFGESTAISIALRGSESDWILTLPAYHQVDPDSLPRLFETAAEADMVIARRWPLKGHLLNRWSNALFNRTVRFLTGLEFGDLGCGVRLIRRSVAAEVSIYGEQHRFLPILAARRGFDVVEVRLPQAEEDKALKIYGPTTYAKRVIDLLAIFFLVKFTKRPLRFFGMIGSILIATGAAILAIVAIQRLFMSVALADRPILLLGLLLVVLGVQLFAVGLIGELIIFVHARDLDEYAIAERINFRDGQDPKSGRDETDRKGETAVSGEKRAPERITGRISSGP